MNKKLKTALWIAIGLLLVLVVLFAAQIGWTYFTFKNTQEETSQTVLDETTLAEILDNVDFDSETGMLYVNNQIIVFTKTSASDEDVAEFLSSQHSTVDDSMADIGVYNLIYPEAKTYDELQVLIRRIQSDPVVENAYLNLVTQFESDSTEEKDFEYKDPVQPNDPWEESDWNVSVPRGNNWGVEAINAPGAWGYLDQLSIVNVGLIDSMPDQSHEDLNVINSTCYFVDDREDKVLSVNSINISAADHGTHVAGTINATWDNDKGLSGVMGGKGRLFYSASYFMSNGEPYMDYATAYTYLLSLKALIDQDVQVINISQNSDRLKGFAASHGNANALNFLTQHATIAEQGLERIIAERTAAGKPDFVICVAAGNNNNNTYYPDKDELYGYRRNMTFWEAVKDSLSIKVGESGNALALHNNFLNMIDSKTVKDRIIVVGAVGINSSASTNKETKYSYTYYSNIGDRVDIVAPGGIAGCEIYSCLPGNQYAGMFGTSMATPHVTGVAGLVFASNPKLTGPEVKEILTSTTTGRYYHGGCYNGLLNANNAVVAALKTVESSTGSVLNTNTKADGLDLCFVVDTTGSMDDDIENAKANMESILTHLSEKTKNYRVALVDYRDYPSRTSDKDDYPYKVQLEFTNNASSIVRAINNLTLGNGGDVKETVYSGLMAASKLEWNANAKKVIIILGDAAPLDPEPETGYTYDSVLHALYTAGIGIDFEESDDRVIGKPEDSMISVFSIGTEASSDAMDFFEDISSSTGGTYANVDDASEVSDAIISSIEQIKLEEKAAVYADFGDSLADQEIHLYSDAGYLFSFITDEKGQFKLDDMEESTYRWTSNSVYAGGTIEIAQGERSVAARTTRAFWFTPVVEYWHQHTGVIVLILCAYIALCILVPVVICIVKKQIRKWKSKRPAKPAMPDPTPVQKDTVSCPDCETDNSAGASFCRHCGHPMQSPPTPKPASYCRNCGTPCEPHEKFCKHCGTALQD